jgi:hypothetical protein
MMHCGQCIIKCGPLRTHLISSYPIPSCLMSRSEEGRVGDPLDVYVARVLLSVVCVDE